MLGADGVVASFPQFAVGGACFAIFLTAGRFVMILYVEDDDLTRRSVAKQLGARGYRVLQAASGEEALGLLSDAPPLTAALLDMELPGIDGVETYRLLLARYERLPVVVCSAQLSDAVRRRLAGLGVGEDQLLSKPCAFSAILEAIERVIRLPGEPG